MLLFVILLFASNHFAKVPDTSRIESEPNDSSNSSSSITEVFKDIFSLEKPDSNGLKSNRQDFEGKEGKIIRKINVRVLDLFGTSIYDTLKQPKNWLSKTGNMLHINTKEWLIKNILLFREGDILDSYQLTESERFLRQNNNIYDSRILAVEIPSAQDSVDILVLVQDIWSISANASINGKIDRGFLSVKDLNFLGYGTEVSTKLKISDQYSNNWDWDGSVVWYNINRSFFTGRFSRKSEEDANRWGVGINKDFFSPVIKWAGGIDMDWSKTRLWIQEDTLLTLNNLNYATFDIWGGFATDFTKKKVLTIKQNRFNFSARIIRTNFSETPDISTVRFQNNTLFLGRIGYAQRDYYKDRYIFGLGRTEDIPVGFIAAVLYGFENGQVFQRPYYGLYSGYSRFNYQIGYMYTGIQLGAFRDKYKWSSTIAGINFLYISRLSYLGTFKLRHYLWSRFSYADDPMVPNSLTIDNDQGLRGAGSKKKGNKKIVLNYENNLFTPLSILGFNIALISFADLALLSGNNESLFNSKLYQGFGLGFRIRNEHLVTGTIQIMFGYYPGSHKFNAFEQTRSFYKFDEYRFGKPGMLNY